MSKSKVGKLVLLILISIWIIFRYGEWLTFAPHQVIEPYGDGFKAYTVIQYHARFDSSYAHFDGMNYPYGEHAIPAATQPLLSFPIKFISNNITDITPYAVPIVNGFMLAGIILCACFLYLIFAHFELPVWYSIATAIGITLLSPQAHRMISHYGLAHLEIIPIGLYLLLKFNAENSWKWSLWLALLAFAAALIHFYLFALLVFLISFFYFVDFLFRPEIKNLGRLFPHYLIQVMLPFAFFFFWMIYNDPISDRPSMPWGYFYYSANLQGTLTSLFQPHFQFFNERILTLPPIDYENHTYVGLAAILILVYILMRWLFSRFRLDFFSPVPDKNYYLPKILLAGFIIYLFSLGLPFSIPGLESLLRYTGPIKQFRSISRFAWIFYYVLNIVAFVSIFHILKTAGKKIFLLPIIAILFFEAYHHSYGYDLSVEEIPEWKEGQYFQDQSKINFDNYQAIVPIPYYNIGSDHFWLTIPQIGLIMQQSLVLSNETGLPLTAAMLTRSSLSQTINQIQLVSAPYRIPKIFEDFPNEKPLLLMIDQGALDATNGRYEHFYGQGNLIFEKGDIQWFELPLSGFQQRVQEKKNDLIAELDSLQLTPHGTLLSTDSLSTFLYQSYDDQDLQSAYLGQGGRQTILKDSIQLLKNELPFFEPGDTAVFSLWCFINKDLIVRSDITGYELDGNSAIIQKITTPLHRAIHTFDNNGWGLVEFVFGRKSLNSSFIFVIENEWLKGEVFQFDELLIRRRDSDLFQKKPSYIWKNNLHFGMEDSTGYIK